MNELPNQIKNLSYCLTILPVSSRCVENFARRHDLRQVIEKLNKALKKHRSKILTLLEKHPQEWPYLRQYFKPLQNMELSKKEIYAKQA